MHDIQSRAHRILRWVALILAATFAGLIWFAGTYPELQREAGTCLFEFRWHLNTVQAEAVLGALDKADLVDARGIYARYQAWDLCAVAGLLLALWWNLRSRMRALGCSRRNRLLMLAPLVMLAVVEPAENGLIAWILTAEDVPLDTLAPILRVLVLAKFAGWAVTGMVAGGAALGWRMRVRRLRQPRSGADAQRP